AMLNGNNSNMPLFHDVSVRSRELKEKEYPIANGGVTPACSFIRYSSAPNPRPPAIKNGMQHIHKSQWPTPPAVVTSMAQIVTRRLVLLEMKNQRQMPDTTDA